MQRVKIGTRLRQVLEEKNLTQTQVLKRAEPILAEKGMKLTKSKLSQYVNNTHAPHGDMIELLADVLNEDPAWLCGFTDIRKPAPYEEDGFNGELARLFNQLTPEEAEKVVAFVQGILAARKE